MTWRFEEGTFEDALIWSAVDSVLPFGGNDKFRTDAFLRMAFCDGCKAFGWGESFTATFVSVR